MLNYAIFCEMKQRMLDMATLTPKLLQSPGAFSVACIEYMQDFLGFSEKYRLYITSDISLAINKVLCFKPEKTAVAGTRYNLRKEKDAFAASCLNDLHGIIKGFIEKDYGVFEECESIWRQILSRALAKGYGEALAENADKIELMFAIAKRDEELLPYYSHVMGLAGVYNSRAILDTVFPQLGIR